MDNLKFSQELESKLLNFAKKTCDLLRTLQKDYQSREFIDQLTRSSCSIGANYIEANEAESRKDFFHRIKICRKEAKESKYWLEIIKYFDPSKSLIVDELVLEVTGYVKLFSSIINSGTNN